MAITVWNNWKLNKEFVFIELSIKEEMICIGLLGLGIIIIL